MISSDFRAEARKKLDGKWGKVALITLAYSALFFLFGFIEGLCPEGSAMQNILSIVITIIEVPLSFGLIISLLKVYNSEDVSAFDFWSLGFKNFSKSWGISFRIALKLILPIVLIIVSIFIIGYSVFTGFISGISNDSAASGSLLFFIIGLILYIVALVWAVMKSYYYSIAYIVAADEENLTAKEVVEKSKQLMIGKRGKLFCLQFSFIGWTILAAFTLGIGYLWLLPYMQFAMIAFYYFVANKNSNTAVNVENEPVSPSDNSSDSLN